MKRQEEIQVEVKELPALNVAYVRHIGPYKGDGKEKLKKKSAACWVRTDLKRKTLPKSGHITI